MQCMRFFCIIYYFLHDVISYEIVYQIMGGDMEKFPGQEKLDKIKE